MPSNVAHNTWKSFCILQYSLINIIQSMDTLLLRESLEKTFAITSRTLTPTQELRIQPLISEISRNKIKITHFITLTYPFKNLSWKNTVKDNKRVSRILRKFSKYYPRLIWFIEKHDNGGYHRHLLCEDPFKVYDAIGTLNCREDLSRVARSVFDKTSLEMMSSNGSGVINFRERLLRNAIVQHNKMVADNEASCHIQKEEDVRSRVSYLTKQFWKKGMEPQDVVDFSNSDIDARISKSWNRGDFWNP